jgi:hypothetical protein
MLWILNLTSFGGGGGEVIIIKKNENFRLEGETMLY